MTLRSVVAVGTAFFILLAYPRATRAQFYSVSYQGLLKQAGLPVTEHYDFEFELFDSQQCGTGASYGDPSTQNGVAVTDGLFTTRMMFPTGDIPEDSNAVFYLEVRVRRTGTVDFQTLCPRQELSDTLRSVNSRWAGVAQQAGSASSAGGLQHPPWFVMPNGTNTGWDAAGEFNFSSTIHLNAAMPLTLPVGAPLIDNLNAQFLSGRTEGFIRDAGNLTGTLPDARLAANVARLDAVAQTFAGANAFGNPGNNFSGVGTGLTALNASNISSGALNDALLSANIPRGNAAQNAFTGSASFAGALDVGGTLNATGGIVHANPINFVGSAVEPILQINGVELIGRQTTNGGVTIGADDSLVIGDGESPGTVAANVDMTLENTYVSSDNSIFFYTNLQTGWAARQVVLFRDDGNVGVATTTPGSRLDVRATGARNAIAGYADTSNYSGVYGETTVTPLCDQETAAVKGRNPTEGVTGALARGSLSGTCEFPVYFGVYGQAGAGDYAGYFDGPGYFSGNVGIGGNNPSYKLNVVGNIRATGTVTASCGMLMCSDARFKKDVQSVAGALDIVDRLCGVTFSWKKEQFPEHNFVDGRQVGFIAQELREVLPEVVIEGPDGYLSVDYARLTPVLVEALHDLRAEKDRQIADLAARLERLECALNAMQLEKGNIH